MKPGLSDAGKVASALALLALVYLVWHSPDPYAAHLDSRHEAMRLLGEFLGRERPGQNVLLFANPFTLKPEASTKIMEHDAMGYHGLKAGLQDRVTLTKVFPNILADYERDPSVVFIPPASKTPLSFVINPRSWDDLANAHPDHTVLVSLIGLPKGVEQLELWKENDPRTVALLLPDFRILGRPAEVIALFEKGKLLAAVIEDSETGLPVLVSKANIAQLLKEQPKAFGY